MVNDGSSVVLIEGGPQNIATLIWSVGKPENTIDLDCFNGVFRKPEAHEDIHDPEYFEAKAEYERHQQLQRNFTDHA